jgi:hypothetical protein
MPLVAFVKVNKELPKKKKKSPKKQSPKAKTGNSPRGDRTWAYYRRMMAFEGLEC